MSTAITEAIVARARAQGWPDGLAERALAVKTPSRQLEQWLLAEAGENFLFQIERTVAVFERLATGPYRGRELTFHDEESFQQLWANGPEKVGDWEVTVERSPDALAQFRLQPGACINVIEAEGEVVACTVWSSANCLIGGKPVSIHYARVCASAPTGGGRGWAIWCGACHRERCSARRLGR